MSSASIRARAILLNRVVSSNRRCTTAPVFSSSCFRRLCCDLPSLSAAQLLHWKQTFQVTTCHQKPPAGTRKQARKWRDSLIFSRRRKATTVGTLASARRNTSRTRSRTTSSFDPTWPVILEDLEVTRPAQRSFEVTSVCQVSTSSKSPSRGSAAVRC